ncbi:MAG: 30S ribosomal protein S17 [Planctomycetes bacterium]|nr:30S ribosomal protein S17 [Planctomycetota bacterium]
MTETANTKDTAEQRNRRMTLQGVVTSDKMLKTITIEIERQVKHPLYEKFIRRRTRVHAHDENREAHVGDLVEVMETRPISKLKRFRLVRVIRRAEVD